MADLKTNLADRALDKLHQRVNGVREKLHKEYKGTKPFRSEPISNEELLMYYSQLTPPQMQVLIEKHGREKEGEFIGKMENMKERRGIK